MTAKTKNAIKKAAKGIAALPPSFETLFIKDSFTCEENWDDFNKALCAILEQCVMPDQLDEFWKENKTFEAMGQYIDENSGS